MATPEQLLTGPLAGMKVVDADTHLTEPGDLWTSRVAKKDQDRVPRKVRDENGRDTWYYNGDDVFARPAGAGSVIRKDGVKQSFLDWNIENGLQWDEVDVGSYDTKTRLERMDEMGIWAQIVYPNAAGFGAHRLTKIPDRDLALLIAKTYNTAMADIQEESGERMFPMALLPFWDIEASAKEVERCAELGLRGITMCSEPQSAGFPNLLQSDWNPLWEAITDTEMVVNFHVGASEFGMEAYYKGTWEGGDKWRQGIVGAAMIELHNAKVLANMLTSDLLDRYPKIKWVSVESGIGWIPYVLERLEYQMLDSAMPGKSLPNPTQQFRDHMYSCFWFEEIGPSRILDRIGFDNVLFETDYPHPTCLYPSPVEHGIKVLEPWGPEVTRKVMSENSIKLYRLPA
ncbi:amidohydrolase family protein [Gordonia sp. NPDC127522]|uniref:amidohydrolase family protein n=1 Tax=Gordonia sp. NPDC127522 TaxID=3345390 RepID=UPI00363BF7C1